MLGYVWQQHGNLTSAAFRWIFCNECLQHYKQFRSSYKRSPTYAKQPMWMLMTAIQHCNHWQEGLLGKPLEQGRGQLTFSGGSRLSSQHAPPPRCSVESEDLMIPVQMPENTSKLLPVVQAHHLKDSMMGKDGFEVLNYRLTLVRRPQKTLKSSPQWPIVLVAFFWNKSAPAVDHGLVGNTVGSTVSLKCILSHAHVTVLNHFW